jgi:hypothetical protein
MSVFLSDVSFYQGVIDFAKMKQHVNGVIIRAGQKHYLDSRFIANWSGAKAHGIPRGSYWFYDSRHAPKAQAQLWWNAIANDRGELAHFLDLEESYGGAYTGWKNWQMCLQEFERLSNGKVKIGIYTGPGYWNTYKPLGDNLSYFAKFPLWIAHYGVANPTIPAPWTRWLFWQYGVNPPRPAKDYGVETMELDSNHFNGSLTEYNKYFGLDGTIPDPPSASNAWRVIAPALNVRIGPGVAYKTATSAMQRGDIVEGVLDAPTNWIKIAKITRGTTIIFPTSAWYCSGNSLYVEKITAPEAKTTVQVAINGVLEYTGEV